MYARTHCRCARSPSGHGQRYPAVYLLRGAGYKINPPPPGGQVGYGIVLIFSKLWSPFGVEFGFTHFWGCAMRWQTNRNLWRYEYMAGAYYKPCKEFDICNELIEKYWESKQYDKCFEGHLVLAEQGYPLAECQIGYFYYEGLGVEKDLEKALYWTRRAAEHGDRDGQCNLAWFYEDAIGVERDIEQAKHWYRLAALQNNDLAIEKCKELGVAF